MPCNETQSRDPNQPPNASRSCTLSLCCHAPMHYFITPMRPPKSSTILVPACPPPPISHPSLGRNAKFPNARSICAPWSSLPAISLTPPIIPPAPPSSTSALIRSTTSPPFRSGSSSRASLSSQPGATRRFSASSRARMRSSRSRRARSESACRVLT